MFLPGSLPPRPSWRGWRRRRGRSRSLLTPPSSSISTSPTLTRRTSPTLVRRTVPRQTAPTTTTMRTGGSSEPLSETSGPTPPNSTQSSPTMTPSTSFRRPRRRLRPHSLLWRAEMARERIRRRQERTVWRRIFLCLGTRRKKKTE